MKDILKAPWMAEMIRTVTNMYDHGWDERKKEKQKRACEKKR